MSVHQLKVTEGEYRTQQVSVLEVGHASSVVSEVRFVINPKSTRGAATDLANGDNSNSAYYGTLVPGDSIDLFAAKFPGHDLETRIWRISFLAIGSVEVLDFTDLNPRQFLGTPLVAPTSMQKAIRCSQHIKYRYVQGKRKIHLELSS